MLEILYTRQYLNKTHSEYNPRGILLIPYSQNTGEESEFLLVFNILAFAAFARKLMVLLPYLCNQNTIKCCIFQCVPVGSLREFLD